MSSDVYLNALGVINAMGAGKISVRQALLDRCSPGMKKKQMALSGKTFHVGEVAEELPRLPGSMQQYNCRNNRLLLAAAMEIESNIKKARHHFGAERIGVVMGTSTSGVDEAEWALSVWQDLGEMPADFSYTRQEVGAIAGFVSEFFDLRGPAYAISTACSSSGKVFASARGLLESGLCDAVVVGGADTLCELTLNGFASLEAISNTLTNPFSRQRDGINIGEAAAVFLMTREVSGVRLAGIGESVDAYHMSAPDPEGTGALTAMQSAIADAGIKPSQIQYVNLHGTGTYLNDSMESHAVHSLFGKGAACSSSKPFTGHTLGAAGATEAALCWLLLTGEDRRQVIPHLYDGEQDAELSEIGLCTSGRTNEDVEFMMSNSFAFGGNNVSVILERVND